MSLLIQARSDAGRSAHDNEGRESRSAGGAAARHVHIGFTCQTARLANAMLPGDFTFSGLPGPPFPFFRLPRRRGNGAPGGAGPSDVGPDGP